MNKAIISVGVGGWHPKGVARLSESLKDTGWDGDLLTWTDGYPDGSPLHSEVPYAFKPYAFKAAFDLGYTHVQWCDASMWAVKNPDPIFDLIDSQGYFFIENGFMNGQYSSDTSCEYFGYTREQAWKMRQVVGGTIGLHKDKAAEFFKRYIESVPTFKGCEPVKDSWNNDNLQVSTDPKCRGHRHDQTAASFIADQLGCTILPPTDYFDISLKSQTAIFYAQGMW